VYRCSFVLAQNLYTVTSENSLEHYVKRYLKRRLKTMHVTDLHPFILTYFCGIIFTKEKLITLVTFFRARHVQQVIEGVGVDTVFMSDTNRPKMTPTPNITSCF
jgi:hypothetical protein